MSIDTCTSEEIERFKIEHSAEIERILLGVMNKKALVTAYSEDNRDFLVTTLIAIDTDQKALFFGAGPDPATNLALTTGGLVSFNTAHDQVRVLFTSPALSLVDVSGERLLRAKFPKEMLRFQRREYYRLAAPLTHPVKCLINLENGILEALVLDISIGGLGVLSYSQDVEFHEGDIYNGCRLSLPGAGTYVVSLQIRTIYEQSLRSGAISHRVGCQFIHLAASVENVIQRYIIRVERERRLGTL